MLLKVEQVSRELNFSEQQIYRWVRLGALKAVRFSHALRFDKNEIERVKSIGIEPETILSGSENRFSHSRISTHTKKGARLWE